VASGVDYSDASHLLRPAATRKTNSLVAALAEPTNAVSRRTRAPVIGCMALRGGRRLRSFLARDLWPMRDVTRLLLQSGLSLFGQCHGILSGCSSLPRTLRLNLNTKLERCESIQLSRFPLKKLDQQAPDDIPLHISVYVLCRGPASRDHPPGVKADQLSAACQPALFAATSPIC
jgi:hypothetical protein